MPGRSTSGFHRPGTHCLHQARSAVRRWASRMKGELHPTKNRLWGGRSCIGWQRPTNWFVLWCGHSQRQQWVYEVLWNCLVGTLPYTLWWIQPLAWNRAFGLLFRAHHRIELISSIRMNSLHVRPFEWAHIYVWMCTPTIAFVVTVLTFAPGGTSRDKNNKISITIASLQQKIRSDSESYGSGLPGILLVYYFGPCWTFLWCSGQTLP